MRKLVMLAREITKKEIELGIGSENSSTRLSPIFKTLHMNVPIKANKIYKPSLPINPTEGTPLVQVPLLFVPHDTSYIFATPSIIVVAAPIWACPAIPRVGLYSSLV